MYAVLDYSITPSFAITLVLNAKISLKQCCHWKPQRQSTKKLAVWREQLPALFLW